MNPHVRLLVGWSVIISPKGRDIAFSTLLRLGPPNFIYFLEVDLFIRWRWKGLKLELQLARPAHQCHAHIRHPGGGDTVSHRREGGFFRVSNFQMRKNLYDRHFPTDIQDWSRHTYSMDPSQYDLVPSPFIATRKIWHIKVKLS